MTTAMSIYRASMMIKQLADAIRLSTLWLNDDVQNGGFAVPECMSSLDLRCAEDDLHNAAARLIEVAEAIEKQRNALEDASVVRLAAAE